VNFEELRQLMASQARNDRAAVNEGGRGIYTQQAMDMVPWANFRNQHLMPGAVGNASINPAPQAPFTPPAPPPAPAPAQSPTPTGGEGSPWATGYDPGKMPAHLRELYYRQNPEVQRPQAGQPGYVDPVIGNWALGMNNPTSGKY